MKCDECEIKILKEDSVQTVDGKILCYGCDSKRLEKIGYFDEEVIKC
jgi:formylmethanofuran dehydrogenase subunit E